LKIAGLLFDASFVAQVYDLFPVLKSRGPQRAGSMSGGEQQMLALGMALMTKPKWLLLDEPFTGLAPIIIETVMKCLKDVNERYGTGLCIVEQNVPATLMLVDRAIILKSGRVVFDGSAHELEAQRDLWQWF
jgi:branched-chain amino acid transport system ATP-binding protein